VALVELLTKNLGRLRGADSRCQTLAGAAGFGNKTWRAYLSVERDADNNNSATHARDRIGSGPCDPRGTFSSWNSSHANQSCADTAPRGGAGRIHCFAR
jgi:hypothetical protein